MDYVTKIYVVFILRWMEVVVVVVYMLLLFLLFPLLIIIIIKSSILFCCWSVHTEYAYFTKFNCIFTSSYILYILSLFHMCNFLTLLLSLSNTYTLTISGGKTSLLKDIKFICFFLCKVRHTHEKN